MPRPKKTDLAKFKVLTEIGLTPNAIARKTSFDPKTIRAYLEKTELYQNPVIQEMVEKIKEQAISTNETLLAKSNLVLNEYLDRCLSGSEKPQIIPVIAIKDRTFQQNRLLGGHSTENVALDAILREAHATLFSQKPEKKGGADETGI